MGCEHGKYQGYKIYQEIELKAVTLAIFQQLYCAKQQSQEVLCKYINTQVETGLVKLSYF